MMAIPLPPLPRSTLFDQAVHLDAGREWHSRGIALRAGDELLLECRGTVRFYAGLFDGTTWRRVVRRDPGAFPFKFGTDQIAFAHIYKVPFSAEYRVVLRVGVFSNPGAIRMRIELRRFGEAP